MPQNRCLICTSGIKQISSPSLLLVNGGLGQAEGARGPHLGGVKSAGSTPNCEGVDADLPSLPGDMGKSLNLSVPGFLLLDEATPSPGGAVKMR